MKNSVTPSHIVLLFALFALAGTRLIAAMAGLLS
jgi:hypothetical protein